MRISTVAAAFLFLSPTMLRAGPASGSKPFIIEVIDDQTNRGVPLVTLRTTDQVKLVTDSAGIVAIDDPVLMGQTVYFTVASHGYEFPADGFGFRGKALAVKAGESATLQIRRLNVAERLYRVTGPGIYRDTVIAGRKPPIKQPLLNALVAGQDSVQRAIYNGRIHWFWGDTARIGYPLGHFGMAGATSLLPEQGGLDPSVGVDQVYFTDETGFSRPMIKQQSGHPKWAEGFAVVPDEDGKERLVALSSTMKSLGECIKRELVMFNDATQMLEPICDIPLDRPLYGVSHPIKLKSDGKQRLYLPNPFPYVRSKPDLASLKNLDQYEGYTCLVPGSRFQQGKPETAKLERDKSGRLVWGWKRDTACLRTDDLRALLKSGKLKADEIPYLPLDVETKKPVCLHAGSLNYNAHKSKYVLIGQELHGTTSVAGEIWYAESGKPEGPWRWARKIVTHDRYSFYNVVHHPFFDQQGGRMIYFEGTYTMTFSRENDPTPRYDYNQIMYRLDLDDPRLKMPPNEP
jgi:hypothetical protein